MEDPLRQRLERHATSWTGQSELIRAAGGIGFDPNIGRRLSQLEEAMVEPGPAVIIARSSGARVATLLAARRHLRAVICVGYPFHHPKKPEEPERYAHLAHVLTPTLILQGISDVYGGREILEKYAFSPAVTVEFIEADHEFRIPTAQWDAVAERILDFCAAAPAAHRDPTPG
ncbi:MAG: alpha/beta family hydrolase [Roseococcus sp.]